MEKHTAFDLLFETGLRHLYKSEKAVAENLVTMEETASTSELKEMFRHHRDETEEQIRRLEQAFKILDININSSKLQGLPRIADQAKELLKTMVDLNFTDRSKGIDGILAEGKELLRHFAKTDANEFALTTAGQKVEYFEIGCYRALILLAERLGQPEVAQLLSQSLSEEVHMEKKIFDYAQSHLSVFASL